MEKKIEHEVLAKEKYLISSVISWNDEEKEIEVDFGVDEEALDFNSLYECSCGKEFDGICEAEKHLKTEGAM